MKPSPGMRATSSRTPRTRRAHAADTWLAAIALASFVAGLLPDTIVSFHPASADILRQPWVLVLEIPVCLAAVAALIPWARRDACGERAALVATVFAVGALAAALQALAAASGWWQGPAYDAPWPALALAGHRGAVSLAAHLGLILVAYRWLASRHPRLALPFYALVMLVVIPGTLAGDLVAIGDGEYAYRNGFTIATDLLYGEALFAAQLALFELLRRHLTPRQS